MAEHILDITFSTLASIAGDKSLGNHDSLVKFNLIYDLPLQLMWFSDPYPISMSKAIDFCFISMVLVSSSGLPSCTLCIYIVKFNR